MKSIKATVDDDDEPFRKTQYLQTLFEDRKRSFGSAIAQAHTGLPQPQAKVSSLPINTLTNTATNVKPKQQKIEKMPSRLKLRANSLAEHVYTGTNNNNARNHSRTNNNISSFRSSFHSITSRGGQQQIAEPTTLMCDIARTPR